MASGKGEELDRMFTMENVVFGAWANLKKVTERVDRFNLYGAKKLPGLTYTNMRRAKLNDKEVLNIGPLLPGETGNERGMGTKSSILMMTAHHTCPIFSKRTVNDTYEFFVTEPASPESEEPPKKKFKRTTDPRETLPDLKKIDGCLNEVIQSWLDVKTLVVDVDIKCKPLPDADLTALHAEELLSRAFAVIDVPLAAVSVFRSNTKEKLGLHMHATLAKVGL